MMIMMYDDVYYYRSPHHHWPQPLMLIVYVSLYVRALMLVERLYQFY